MSPPSWCRQLDAAIAETADQQPGLRDRLLVETMLPSPFRRALRATPNRGSLPPVQSVRPRILNRGQMQSRKQLSRPSSIRPSALTWHVVAAIAAAPLFALVSGMISSTQRGLVVFRVTSGIVVCHRADWPRRSTDTVAQPRGEAVDRKLPAVLSISVPSPFAALADGLNDGRAYARIAAACAAD